MWVLEEFPVNVSGESGIMSLYEGAIQQSGLDVGYWRNVLCKSVLTNDQCYRRYSFQL